MEIFILNFDELEKYLKKKKKKKIKFIYLSFLSFHTSLLLSILFVSFSRPTNSQLFQHIFLLQKAFKTIVSKLVFANDDLEDFQSLAQSYYCWYFFNSFRQWRHYGFSSEYLLNHFSKKQSF
jgi:hypothetical protein